MQSKYGRVFGYDPFSISLDKSSSSTLTSLRKIGQMGWDHSVLKNGFCWKIKDGRSVRFWEDIWYGRRALQKEFDRLFQLSGIKTASVRLVWEIWQSCGGLPPTIWSRQLRAWELEQAEILNQILSTIQFGDGKDVWFWNYSGKCFSTKECYMAISNVVLVNPKCLSFWKFKIPPKVKFFLWKLEHKVLPTKVLLAGRLHNLNLSPICSRCSMQEETLQHLFLECEMAKWCWDEVCNSWSIR